MPIIYNIILLVFLSSFCFAQDSRDLERIVVKSSRDTTRNSLRNNYPSQEFTFKEINQANLDSLPDLFSRSSGIDLRYRGTSGIQGDLSLRGSTFEEVAIAIDGLNVMDPQTGHHNLDVPLTVYDLERVEVNKTGASSLYGAGGLAGAINMIIKKPDERAGLLDALFGEHALFGQGFSITNPNEIISSRISFEHKISKAARPNTDFEYKIASLTLDKDFGSQGLESFFGYQKKDFGADSFYSNLFPEEEEHTETLFGRIGLDSKLYPGNTKNSLYLRKHRDKFILRRNNPTSVNYHTTYVYGFDSNFDLPFRYADLILGLNVAREEINSTNLGKHSNLREAFSFGMVPKLTGRFSLDLRARADHYQKWGWEESFNIGSGYQFIEDILGLKGSISRSFRIPTFTDLYYSDAANKGDPNLKPEDADSFSLGLHFKHPLVEIGLDGFYRQGRNLIDYTRLTSSDIWQATNLGRVDFRGIEFMFGSQPKIYYKGLSLNKIKFSYNYTDADKKVSSFQSKYALDILKHQYLFDIYTEVFGLNFDCQLSYNQRYYGETYFVGNLYLGKDIIKRNFTLEPFVKIDNFTNTEYTEVGGVLQPGRWIKSGMKLKW